MSVCINTLCMTLIEYNRIQMEEILRHKWHLSEKAGYDVGLDYASLDWIKYHSAIFREENKHRITLP
jgi:hypothetical protein